jgi:hypothetical protein
MVEMDTQNRDEDAINAELFGNDVRVDYVLIPFNVKHFKDNLENMIKNAKNDEDLDKIGLKLDEAIDNKYNLDVMDYQFKAARKMTEIESKSKVYRVA